MSAMNAEQGRVYAYGDARRSHSSAYTLPHVRRFLAELNAGARVLDFGCGNGSISAWLASRGFDVVGVDLSQSGIEVATAEFPGIAFSTDTSLQSLRSHGPFDAILCSEVLAHCFDPLQELKNYTPVCVLAVNSLLLHHFTATGRT